MPGLVLPYRNLPPRIAPDAFIAETAVVIGDVQIGAASSVWYGCVIRGDVNSIRIGANTNVQDGTVIHCTHDRTGDYRVNGGGVPTIIGNDVTIGHMVVLHACTVEDGAFIGMRSTLMDGVVVESGAMVAAGALVTPNKRVKRGELWAGKPARRLRLLTAAEQADFAYSAAHYVRLAASYRPVETT